MNDSSARYAALAGYEILDTPRESDFDDIVKIAAEICGAPISLISLIDHDRQWFKAETGASVRETPLNNSMCIKLMHLGKVSVIPDAAKDSRFDDNSLIHGDFGLRFYAGAPLETPDGVPIGMLCVLDKTPRDLTAQQIIMLQALARQVMVQLELRKALREQTRISEELAESRNRAQAANIAKTEFLSNMSHEIRTPMNAIIGLSEILGLTQPLTAKQTEFIKTLQMSADSLLALINDLLDIAKIEARTVDLEHIPFKLTQIMQEVISMMGVRVQEKGLTFTISDEAVADQTYWGDPTRLRQIILNLCSNAVKFTEVGSIDIVITRQVDNDSQDLIEIAVIDTGIGISADHLETIFEKFVQADSSISRRYGGTGLGLAITQMLIKIMGGSITVESRLGEGSTFKVLILLERASEEIPVKSVLRSPPVNQDKPAVKKHRILLVEDYAPNIIVATAFLDDFGYEYDIATNGLEAVDKVKNGNYLAVLMDVQMHGMSGLTATQIIREDEAKRKKPRMPIIGMTAHALSGDRERCLAAGMDDYIAKPFSSEEVRKKLVQYHDENNRAIDRLAYRA